MQRKSPAETIWICCESSWGKEGVEDSHQAPCHWWWQHLCYKAVGSPDAGCHLSRLVDGLTAFLMQDERRKETVTRKSAGSWRERLTAHARGWITHAKPPPERWTVSTKTPASSPALSPDQTWLRPALFLPAIPLVPNSLVLPFINRMTFTKQAYRY